MAEDNKLLPWVIDDGIKDAIGWIAFLITLSFVFSPVKDVRKILQNKNTDNLLTAFPYFTACINGMMWTLYQLPEAAKYVPPLLLNTLGCLSFGTYGGIYWYYTNKKEKCICLRNFCLLVAYLIFSLCMQVWLGREWMGYLAALMNVLVYYSPLVIVGEVIRTRSVDKMPILPSITLFFCSFTWFVYGVYAMDIPILIPNFIGFLLSSLQIIIYLWVFRQQKKLNLERNDHVATITTTTIPNGSSISSIEGIGEGKRKEQDEHEISVV